MPCRSSARCPHDLSIIGLFLQSDAVVKVVMLILLVASFWSWAVIFDKVIRLRRLRFTASNFEESFWSGGSLDDLYERVGQRPPDPMSAVFSAAMREWRRSAAKNLLGTPVMRASLQQRVERVMSVTVGREMERVERFMAYLATVGSTAPFVGLFGTVWGIMDSFQSIAASKNTSLAVVAPGIAEVAVRDRARARRCDPRGHRLQQARDRFRALCRSARSVCLRVQRDPVAPARREAVSYGGIEPRRQRPAPGGAISADVGDQRDAVRRRHAGAARRLHGRRTPLDGRGAGRSAGDPGAADHRAEGTPRHHDQRRGPHLHPGDRRPDRIAGPAIGGDYRQQPGCGALRQGRQGDQLRPRGSR